MNKKKMIKITLIFELCVLGLGGWLLHYRIHPPVKGEVYFIPFFSGIVSVFCLPLLFWFRKTLNLAYIINGFLVIIGTIMMAHFSIKNFQGPLTLTNIIVNTLFADIALAWGKFGVGKAMYVLEYLKSDADTVSKGRYFRFPNMGWWWVHLVGLAAVYTAGNILWK
jgi:hypothetical protein